MTSAGVFLAGVGTTILLIGAGFGGGLMLARTTMEPMAAASGPIAAERLPPARVILPASAEAASPPQPPSATVPEPGAEPSPRLVQTKEVQQLPERDRAAERAERRKADEQERRKRVTERKAKREVTRNAKQQHEREQAPGILAFGGDDEHPPGGGGFFGN